MTARFRTSSRLISFDTYISDQCESVAPKPLYGGSTRDANHYFAIIGIPLFDQIDAISG